MTTNSKEDASKFNEIFSQSVELSNGYVRNNVLTVARSVRNIDDNKRNNYLYKIPLQSSVLVSAELSAPIEVSSDVKYRKPSPSGEKLLILKETFNKKNKKKNHIFEIWQSSDMSLQQIIKLPTLVSTDFSQFGSISWNKEEDALVYVAQKPEIKYTSFFDKKEENDEKVSPSETSSSPIIGAQFTIGKGILTDFGEKYTPETSQPTIFLLSLKKQKIRQITNIPKHVLSLGQVSFSPCGNSIIYSVWGEEVQNADVKRKLGIVYCQQRPAKLYVSPIAKQLSYLHNLEKDEEREDHTKDGEYECLTPNSALSFSPRVSVKKNKIIFLCSEKGFDTHLGCLELHSFDWDLNSSSIVPNSRKALVEVVTARPDKITDFPGLYLTHVPTEAFSHDETHLYLLSSWIYTNRIIQVNIEDGTLTPLFTSTSSSASQSLVCSGKDAKNDILIFTESEPNLPPIVKTVQIPFTKDPITPIVLFKPSPIAISSFSPVTAVKFPLEFEYSLNPCPYMLILPKEEKSSSTDSKLPLIVIPHGGPHSFFATAFTPALIYLASHGNYALVLMNYCGSIGNGQSSLYSLPGSVGREDVQDLVDVTNKVLKLHENKLDSNRVGVCGGSHGGFLASHCIGQHPNLFKVAALRNPVTDIASMISSTDIPDWCFVEALGINQYPIHSNKTNFQPTKEQLQIMFDKSPIAYIRNVRAPTLIALGGNDKRVPMRSQGLEYFYRLNSVDVRSKCLYYAEDGHSLDTPQTESDHWVNIKQWFDKFL